MNRSAIRITALIGLLVFLDLALWSAITPLLSYWSRTIGMTKPQAGIISGVYSGAIVLASIPAGHMADRLGAKKVTLAATALFALAAPLTGFADAVWEVLVLRLLQGIFSAVSWSAGIAWLAAVVGSSSRARAIGLVNAVVPLGMVAGPALGGPLVGGLGPGVAMTGFGVVVAVLFLALATQPDAVSEHHEQLTLRETLSTSLRDSWLLVANCALFVIAFGQTLVQTLAPLHLKAGAISQSEIGYVFMGVASMSLVATVATTQLGARMARWRSMIVAVGVCCGGLVCVLLAAPLGIPAYITVLVLYAAPQSVAFTAAYALASDGAARSGVGQGIAMAALSTTWGIGAFLSPTALAPLADATDDRLAFGVVAALMVVSALGLVALSRRGTGPTVARARGVG